MASVSSTHLIMFIGSLLIATAVAGTVVVEVGSMSDSIEIRGESVAEDIETDIVIISDESQSDSIVDENGNVTLLVKNVGATTIPPNTGEIDVLVDGSHNVPDDVSLVSSAGGDWEPGTVAEITVETDQTFDGEDIDFVVIVGSNEDSITTHVGEE